ncbi:hypothetical protein [Paenibacillus sp. NPDC058174]|uniref:hypothetical protein n=1 Tax=Paenibacillus sp. NPDC058174 TaxID=3346366 RepID=UPI0036DA8BC6
MRSVKYIIVGTLVLSAILVGFVFAQQNSWDLFKRSDGFIIAQDDVVVKLVGEKEKKEIVDSLDPLSNRPTKVLDSKSIQNENTTHNVRLQEDGLDDELVILTAKKNGKSIALPNPDRGYTVTNVPGTEQAIIGYNGSLYLLDISNDQAQIKKFLMDQVQGYDKNKIMKRATEKEGEFVLWGTEPSVNPKGTKVVFSTNRSSENDGELWVKDLISGKEKSIGSPGAVLAWDDQDHVYLQSGPLTVQRNTDSGESTTLLSDWVNSVTISYPYMVYSPDENKLIIQNLKSKEEKSVGLNGVVRKIVSTPQGLCFAMMMLLDATAPGMEIIILNAETGEIKTIKEPKNAFFEEISWLDAEHLLIATREPGTTNQSTYEVNIHKLK